MSSPSIADGGRAPFSHLLQPLQVGSLRLRNRMVMAPMGNRLWNEAGEPQRGLHEYFIERVTGGVSMVVVGAASTHAGYYTGWRAALWNDAAVPGLRRFTDALHAAGAPVLVQLQHDGPSARPPVTPSGVPCLTIKGDGFTDSHALSTAEVEDLRDAFIAGAVRARSAGFDGVELGGQAGYLLGQFVTARLNQRTDRYGGSAVARMQFALEMLRGIRARCGDEFVVGYALSADELLPDGTTLEESVPFAVALEASGLSYLDVRVGTHETFALSTRATAHNRFQSRHGIFTYTAAFKRAIGIPVFAPSHGCYDPHEWDAALARGDADVIQIGKPLLADPQFPAKVVTNALAEIRPCVYCLQCLEPTRFFDAHGPRIYCAVNPRCGAEARLGVEPPARLRRIAVVGAGPAGLEAARVAASRGHSVTLHDRAAQPGGQLNLIAATDDADVYLRLRDWLLRECAAVGVRCEFGTEVTAEALRDGGADAVILATGLQPPSLPVPRAADAAPVYGADDVLLGAAAPRGDVLILGSEQRALLLARRLARVEGVRSVMLLDAAQPSELARGCSKLERAWLTMVDLPSLGIRARVRSTLLRLEARHALIRNEYGERERLACDGLVLAMPGPPDDALAASLQAMGIETHRVGDVLGARTLGDAMHEGAAAACAV